MDVIDDLIEDAEQVRQCNPWLVYGDELHRLREFGTAFKELDLIDEVSTRGAVCIYIYIYIYMFVCMGGVC